MGCFGDKMLGFLRKKQSGKEVFDIVKGYYDHNGFKYRSDDENLILASSFGGDDLPIGIIVHVNSDASTLQFSARLMFEVPEHAKQMMLEELNALNNQISIGCFYLEDVNPVYKVVHFYEGSKVTEDTVEMLQQITLKITDMHDGMLKDKLPEEWKVADNPDNDHMYG